MFGSQALQRIKALWLILTRRIERLIARKAVEDINGGDEIWGTHAVLTLFQGKKAVKWAKKEANQGIS